MAQLLYNWKRFWYLRGTQVHLNDYGYLPNPELTIANPKLNIGHFFNPNIVSFQSIATIPCLVLIGEPEIGKSTEIQKAFRQVPEAEEKDLFELGSYGSDDALCNAVFKGIKFQSWKQGTHRFHLFLDSFDEGYLSIKQLSAILIRELKNIRSDCSRLQFRITCRTNDWSSNLEETLKELWGENNVGIYQLAPLQRGDILEAASKNNLDCNQFSQEVFDKEIVSLAIKPITLKLLLDIYKRNQQLPNTQKELYLQGCEYLCNEHNKYRNDVKIFPKLNPKQILIVAARIAAITIFCNRAVIWKDPDPCPEEDISIQKLWGSTEKAEGNQFSISRNEIQEVLGTGLFSSEAILLSSTNTNCIGFAQKTYAEFLAAWYLEQNQMSLPQIMNLIRHPDGKLVPQLHETAAWLANLLPNVFREIMKTDPDVLLRSDLATANVEDRVALVETLLKFYDEEQILERPLENYRHYKKLAHPSLAAQLQPYISDLNKKEQVRLIAIDIAEVCELQELKDDLVEVVLEEVQPIMIRLSAAQAINSLNDTEAKNKLRTLVFSNIINDSDSRLRLYLLNSLFPDCLNTEELFTVLTEITLNFSFGLYDYYFASKLKDYLHPDDLLVSLAWIEDKQAEVNFLRNFFKVTDSILLKAFENIDKEGVAEALAKVVLSQLRHYDQIMNHAYKSEFLEALNNDDEKRRKVLGRTLPLLSNLQDDLSLLAYTSTPLVFTKDIPWMINCMQASISEQEQRVLAQSIHTVFKFQETEHVDTIRSVSQSNKILAEVFALDIAFIDSPSSQVKQSEKEHQFSVLHKLSPPSILNPLAATRIIELLDEFGDVNLIAWEDICREMVLKPNSSGYQPWEMLETDLTVLPGWSSADTATKTRIIEAAKKYLFLHNLGDYTASSQVIYEDSLFGYKALKLLLKENLTSIQDIPINVWQKWTPFILAYSPSEKTYVDRDLLKRAYINSPDTFLNTLLLLINQENEAYSSVFIISELETIWDSTIADFILEAVKIKNLKPNSLECLLSQLLKHHVAKAKIFAESLIPLPLPTNKEERAKAIMSAKALIKYSENAGWATVWPAIQEDSQFGVELIEQISFFARNSGNIESRLSEEQLTELYVWLTKQYPKLNIAKRNQSPNSDPIFEKNLVAPEVSIDRWKDLILSHLKERGTPQAYEALQQICQQLPQLQDKLKPILIQAQESIRRQTWIPAQPDEIIEIAKNQQARLVKNGNELLNIIIEALDELQQRLQGETPAAIDLWNEIKWTQIKNLANWLFNTLEKKLKNGLPKLEELWELNDTSWKSIKNCSYIPKEEERLSDYIKRYLEETLKAKGIILHREVEIRRGELTDIYVNSIGQNSLEEVYGSMSVIIEVKGCWNKKDLNNAMETQLRERYLRDNRCQHGLYLIGWFNCEQWDESDMRKQNAPKISLEEAREKFNFQAAQLSQQGVQIKAYILNAALR
ncbi:NACHT domain-containing protein [Nostoc sp.]|uniref:NACHT domain-containing protein n=1 Tax=Nostoc sp. TaxID=1180 RepID=UPI002FF5C16E